MGLFDFLRGGKSKPDQGSSNSHPQHGNDEPQGDMGTPLFDACLAGNVIKVRALLDAGTDPNVRSFVNYPEDELFRRDLPQEVGALLFGNAMAHRTNPGFFHHMELGITNLYFPALNGDSSIVGLLLEAGADPNAISFNGLFPLYTAAEIGNLTIVKDLVEHGADVNRTTPKGCTAILNAAEEGKLDVIEYLLSHGADPYIRNAAGSTAIDAALRCGQTAAAQLIARCSRSSNEKSTGSPDSILQGILIDAGVGSLGSFDMDDLLDTIVEQAKDALLGYYGQDVMDALSNTRRMMLRSNDDARMLPTLLADADSDDVARDFIVSVVKSYFLIKFILGGSELRVKGLLADGASPIARCRYDGTLHTPIVAAARSGNIEICKLLIEAGADVNQAQSNSETALANASQLGDCDMTVFLLDNGANPNAVTYAGTALAVADSLAIVMILAAWGADPNVADRDGDLPIIGFIDQGEYAIVQALIDLGSDTSHNNRAGETPVERASKRGDDRMLGIVLGEERYEPENSVFVPKEFASVLERKIHFLRRLAYPLDVYQDYGDSRDPEKLTQAQEDEFAQAIELSRRGLEAKRSGDLISANDLYIKAFSGDIIPRSANVWGWFQVLLVAKDFRDARLVLRFYHAISASYNCIRRDRGEIDHEIESGLISDCFLTLEFKGYQVLRECMRVWPFDRRAVEDKITTYTGLDPALKPYYSGDTPVWRRPYHMSDEEYGLFLRHFVFNAREEDGYERALALDPDREREFLEAEIRSGNIEAHSSLARLIYEEDEQRAVELCEHAVATYEDQNAMFFLAWLLEDSNPARSKELYQRLVDAGSCYGAANNLAYLIKGEDPVRAENLYQKAIEDGNTELAPKGLADLIKDRDPERAKELYEMAIESGNASALTDLALLLESRDPDKAIQLYKRAIEAGDVYSGAHFLGLLLANRDVEQSIRYSEMAVEAGNHFWPPYNIANLIRDKDKDRATELYRLSADAGNNDARVALARLIYTDDRQEAIRLCEAAVDSGDLRDGAFFLAWLLEGDDVERSMELYQLCIDSGYCMGAANNLGLLLKADDQERAKQLFELAIESGDSYYATANLADMLAKDSPDRAAQLYQASIDAGNLLQCAKLARMLLDSDKDRARELCEKAVEAGDRGDAAFVLAWLLEGSNLERAKELYQECVDAGFCWGPARNLANLVKDDDPEHAAELYEMELQAGNVAVRVPLARLISSRDRQRAIQLCEEALEDGDVDDAPFYLAWLLEREDIERSKDLYQACIDNGRSSSAASNLGLLVKAEDPTRAKELFELAIESGNSFYATANLADMLVESDPERAAELYDKALQAGNTTVRVPLAKLLIDSDRHRAAQLFEEAIADGDEDEGLHWLAWMLEGTDRPRAIELYQRRIDAGNFWGSAFNLARLIESEEPKRALELYKMELESTNRGIAAESIANLLAYTLLQPDQATTYYEMAMDSGRDTDANCLNSYGVLLMTRDRDKAMGVFRQAIEAGNLSYATCNLGHMLFFEDPDEAESLYRTSMEHEAQSESTEAYIGLSLLLENSDPEQSSALLETAMSRANFRDSIEFMAEYYQCVNPAHSERLRAMTTEV